MADFSADASKVWLEPHNPTWGVMAISEAARLMTAAGENLIVVHHIGSTAIPGITAKPTIDLMPEVNSLAELEARRPEIEALGYLWRGEFGIEGRRYCVREEIGQRLFHVHFYERGSPQIATHLAFRDYIRAHRDEALAYEAIKREAAALHPSDSLKYNDHKAAWIRSCQERAKAWACRP